MIHQLAPDFYPGWNRDAAAPASQQSVFRRLMERLGFAGGARTHTVDLRRAHLDRAFFTLGEAMLQRTQAARQPLSVAVFEVHDLPELESVFGRKVARRVGDQALAALTRVAGRKGLARRTGPTTFAVLLPQLRVDGALAAIHAVFGRTCCIELDSAEEDIVLVPDLRVRTVREGRTVRAEYESLRTEIARAHARQQRHLQYLERERVSHSKPMTLRPAWPATRPGDLARNLPSTDLHASIPETVPVSLGRD